MSNLVDHANREFDRLGYPQVTGDRPLGFNPETWDPDTEMRRCALEIIEVFAKQGHSGFSAAFLLSMLPKLMDFKPLSPITDDPAEWKDVGGGMWQNIRSSDCFSHDDGKTYYSVDDKNFWYVKWLYKLPIKVRKLVWKKYRFLVQPIHKSQEAKQLTTAS